MTLIMIIYGTDEIRWLEVQMNHDELFSVESWVLLDTFVVPSFERKIFCFVSYCIWKNEAYNHARSCGSTVRDFPYVQSEDRIFAIIGVLPKASRITCG
jgi:hypothetical protein